MSIFPKKTIRGKPVTIHWNFNGTSHNQRHICPYVRIGVTDPLGNTTMLFEQHVLAFPHTATLPDHPTGASLRKETPLLVFASYLQQRSGRHQIKEMLGRMESGTHHYFTFHTPPDAIPGKYILLSELYAEGTKKHSLTRDDDFFFVEVLDIKQTNSNTVTISNLSGEACLAELITLTNGNHTIENITIPGLSAMEAVIAGPAFLRYSESREIIALHALHEPLLNKNQLMITLPSKEEANTFHVMHTDEEEGYLLENEYAEVWRSCNGLEPKADGTKEALSEMTDAGLVIPMYEFSLTHSLKKGGDNA